jgi:hypothetical protein
VCCRSSSVRNERIHSRPEWKGLPCAQPERYSERSRSTPWAVGQATAELYDVDDPDVIIERARELVREAELLEEERHDEYDDPDQGGEA